MYTHTYGLGMGRTRVKHRLREREKATKTPPQFNKGRMGFTPPKKLLLQPMVSFPPLPSIFNPLYFKSPLWGAAFLCQLADVAVFQRIPFCHNQ